MEGATLGMNYGLNRMRSLGVTPQRVRLTGAGARNRAWRQIIADVFGAEVVCMRNEDTVATGAAIHAKWTHDNFRGRRVAIQALTDALVHTDETTRLAPDPAKAAVYADRQKILDEASKSLRSVFTLHRAVTS
jgi:sugar (pentulose or hexulose) kinase